MLAAANVAIALVSSLSCHAYAFAASLSSVSVLAKYVSEGDAFPLLSLALPCYCVLVLVGSCSLLCI